MSRPVPRPGPSACEPHTRMKPRSRYISHSSWLTQERRRARARSSDSVSRGARTSQSSATTTIAVALRASSMALAAAGGLGEEDDALGVARHLVEAAHHLRLAATAGAAERHRGPQPLVELL